MKIINNKNLKLYKYIAYTLALTFIAIAVGHCSQKFYNVVETFFTKEAYAAVTWKADTPWREPTMKEWIKMTVEEAGIDWNEASKVMDCESKGNPDAFYINYSNNAGVDRGIWQISSHFHPDVSNECAYNYKCATFEMIKIHREWGNNFCAWTCGKKLGFCK